MELHVQAHRYSCDIYAKLNNLFLIKLYERFIKDQISQNY